MTNADLGSSLETVAAQVFSSLYIGKLGRTVTDHMTETGSLIARSDLAAR